MTIFKNVTLNEPGTFFLLRYHQKLKGGVFVGICEQWWPMGAENSLDFTIVLKEIGNFCNQPEVWAKLGKEP